MYPRSGSDAMRRRICATPRSMSSSDNLSPPPSDTNPRPASVLAPATFGSASSWPINRPCAYAQAAYVCAQAPCAYAQAPCASAQAARACAQGACTHASASCADAPAPHASAQAANAHAQDPCADAQTAYAYAFTLRADASAMSLARDEPPPPAAERSTDPARRSNATAARIDAPAECCPSVNAHAISEQRAPRLPFLATTV